MSKEGIHRVNNKACCEEPIEEVEESCFAFEVSSRREG